MSSIEAANWISATFLIAIAVFTILLFVMIFRGGFAQYLNVNLPSTKTKPSEIT